jgi:superfamily II DNA/RNA helicase
MVLDEADRLLDMGFENTIMEICGILSGSGPDDAAALSGDAVVVVPTEDAKGKSPATKDKAPLKIMDINQKWRQQSLTKSKLCSSYDSLSYVMVSATLTSALKRISFPIMGGKGFTVVDAEKESCERVETLADLSTLGRDTGRLDGKVGKVNVHHDDDEMEIVTAEEGTNKDSAVESGGSTSKSKKERSSDLALNEQINTPSQLSQYFMMVTCKWRLAALLCFLKMHAHEKVMVFFATCDSVDYHALLLNNAKVGGRVYVHQGS